MIPDSTNTWQSVIEAAPADQMMPPNVLRWVHYFGLGTGVVQKDISKIGKCKNPSFLDPGHYSDDLETEL